MNYRKALSAFLRAYLDQLRTEAEKMQAQTMPELTEESFCRYEQTGSRAEYETVYFARRKFLMIFGLKALAEQKLEGTVSEKTGRKLSEVIENICREECWAVPAHLSRSNADWRITIDLFAAETAQTLSELSDRLCNALPTALQGLIRENVENRVLLPFLASERYGWEKSDHNWNAVCTGSIGSACIHLWGKSEGTDRCVERVCDSLRYYIDGFADDGTCMEGCGYYTYGMSYFVNFAQELLEYSGGQIDLLRGDWGRFRKGAEDKRSRIAAFQGKCFFPDGAVVNFSDGNRRDKFSLGLLLALKHSFERVAIPDLCAAADLLHDHCYRFVFRKLDLFETEKYLQRMHKCEAETAVHNTHRSLHILPDAQWCIASAQNGTGFACKGGHNAEPHNHNDVGHFIYEAKGTALLADLGAGEYTRDYFGQKRYEILCNNSFGHSVPVLNGRGQLPGREFSCGMFEAEADADALTVRMDLSAAYAEVRGTFCREMKFSLPDGKLTVADSFCPGSGVAENLITQCVPVLKDGSVILSGPEVSARLRISGDPVLTINELPHRGHRGEQETVYAIQWTLLPGQTNTVFEIEILEP